MANHTIFATLMLVSWPFVSMIAFRLLSFPTASLVTVLGGYLLLPGVAVKLAEGIPQIDKVSSPGLAALIAFLVMRDVRRVPPSPRSRLLDLVICIFVASPLVTSVLNGDTVTQPWGNLPGVGWYDGLSAVVSQLTFVAPFLLARACFRSEPSLRPVLTGLVVASILYILPALFEIRMSPVLSVWVYGFQTFQFQVEYRYGLFRPVVFLGIGLTVSFLFATGTMAAAARWKQHRSAARASILIALAIMLLLARSFGSIIYGTFGSAAIIFLRPTTVAIIAAVVGTFCVGYPVLRATQQVPVGEIISAFQTVDEDRSQSLSFRFEQEEGLLNHALERKWFGWGRFGRNRIFEESGKDDSVTDGLWIITLGQFGLVGFLAQFTLLLLPILQASRVIKLENQQEASIIAAISMTIAFTLLDQLVNASLSPWSLFVAGALAGRVSAWPEVTIRPSATQPFLFTRIANDRPV